MAGKTDGGTQAGRLRERLEVLELRSVSADTPRIWAWAPIRRTWADFTLMTRPNVWSVHGIGAAGVSFTLRRQPLSLDSALRWRGQHCLITAIRPLGRLYLTVDAALVVLSRCRDPRTGTTFPAVMTQEYVRHQQLEPMAVNTCRRVLVTPKAARLARDRWWRWTQSRGPSSPPMSWTPTGTSTFWSGQLTCNSRLRNGEGEMSERPVELSCRKSISTARS